MASSNAEDIVAIQGLIGAYAAAIDEKNYDLLDSVFTPDAELIYEVSDGNSVAGPYPRVKKWIAKIIDQHSMCEHLMGMPRITIEGDTARARTMLINPMQRRREGGEDSLGFFGGVYHDICVRTADGWRISRRHEIGTWSVNAPSDVVRPTLDEANS